MNILRLIFGILLTGVFFLTGPGAWACHGVKSANAADNKANTEHTHAHHHGDYDDTQEKDENPFEDCCSEKSDEIRIENSTIQQVTQKNQPQKNFATTVSIRNTLCSHGLRAPPPKLIHKADNSSQIGFLAAWNTVRLII